MTTMTKKSAKELAGRIGAQNLDSYMQPTRDRKVSIEMTLPSWLNLDMLTKSGPDREAFEKKIRQTLRAKARSKGYTIRGMEESIPKPSHDLLKGRLKYYFTREGDHLLVPVR